MLIDNFPRDQLLKPLQTVIGIVERKQSLPILSNVLIEKTGGGYRFTATDLEVQISTEVQHIGGHEYAFTVGAKKMVDILTKFDEEANVSLNHGDHRLQLKSGSSRFNLQTLPAPDFPIIQIPSNFGNHVTMTQSALRKLISEVKYAMAQQDIRYYLNGVLFSLDGDQLSLVATDGHRLAYSRSVLENSYQRAEVIIPRKAINELLRLLEDSQQPVLIGITESNIFLEFSGISFLTKIIDGKFPDYKRVIPAYQSSLLINRKTILSALIRVSILSNEKFHGVRFILTEKNLKIISNNSEQEEAQEDIETNYIDTAIDIGFNVNYLLDGLNNINSETVFFSFGGANSSVLITIPDNDNYKYVVMPMRI